MQSIYLSSNIRTVSVSGYLTALRVMKDLHLMHWMWMVWMSILVENRRRCTQPLFHLIILPHYPMSQTLVVRSSSWSIQRMVPPFLLNSGENQKECEQCCRSAIVCGGDLLLKLGVGSQLGLVIGVVSPKPQKIQRLALLLQRLQERKWMISFLMLWKSQPWHQIGVVWHVSFLCNLTSRMRSHFSRNMWKNRATFVCSCQSFIVSSTQLKCIGDMPNCELEPVLFVF